MCQESRFQGHSSHTMPWWPREKMMCKLLDCSHHVTMNIWSSGWALWIHAIFILKIYTIKKQRARARAEDWAPDGRSLQGNEMLWSGKSSLESHYPGVKLQCFHDFFLLLIILGSCPPLSSLFLVGKMDIKNSQGCHESRINLSAPCHAAGIQKMQILLLQNHRIGVSKYLGIT